MDADWMEKESGPVTDADKAMISMQIHEQKGYTREGGGKKPVSEKFTQA